MLMNKMFGYGVIDCFYKYYLVSNILQLWVDLLFAIYREMLISLCRNQNCRQKYNDNIHDVSGTELAFGLDSSSFDCMMKKLEN